jgi:hypothetical protein
MSHPNELQDAFTNIGDFSPEIQAKIRLWYPKIEAAQRRARKAVAGMIHVLVEPPIIVVNSVLYRWIDERKKYISEYDEAWKQYLSMIKEYQKAVSPACLPKYMAGENPGPLCLGLLVSQMLHTQALLDAYTNRLPPTPARRSPRLAAKPRINYEEGELEEEIEAKEAEQKAKDAQQMRRAEFHKRVAAIPRPNPAAYNASVANFKARNLWQERWSHERHSQDYINHRAIKNEYRAAIAAYNERIAAEAGFA